MANARASTNPGSTSTTLRRCSNGRTIDCFLPDEPLREALARLRSLDLPILGRRIRFQRPKQSAGDRSDSVDRGKKRVLVRFRRLVEAADLAHELQRCRANLLLRHGRGKVEQWL